MSVKRITTKQTNRANPNTYITNKKNAEIVVEDYYRTTIFIPYVDHFIAQLEARFLVHKNIFKGINTLKSEFIIINIILFIIYLGFESIFSKNKQLTSSETESFQNLIEFYSPHINKENSLAELKIWRTKIFQDKIIIKTALDALQVCNPHIYPNINKLIKILCTLPVSTSTPERSFSTLKRVKTYLRNSMTEV